MTSDFPEVHEDPCYSAMEVGDQDLLEIEGWCCRFRQANTDLQDALGKGEEEIHELSQEIALLQEKNKSLQMETAQLPDLKKEMKNLKFKVMRNKLAAELEQQPKNEKERRCLRKEKRADQLVSQVEHCQNETLVLKKDITRLKNLIIDQENRLQKKKLELEEKEEISQKRESIKKSMTTTLNEYATTIEVLNNKMNTLQTKVEEALQEIALRNTMDESSRKSEQYPDDGTLMHEIVQAKLDEKQLLRSEQQKDWGFLWLKLLYTIMLKILWCNVKVLFFSGFFFLLFYYLLPLFQGKEPGFLGWYILSIFSTKTVESIEHILQPCLLRIGSGVVPT